MTKRKTRALVAPLVTLTPVQIERVKALIETKTVEEGDCLVWTAAATRGTGSRCPQPVGWVDGAVRPMRRLAYVAYGHELFTHWRVCTTCGNDLCLADAHLCRKTHSDSLMGHTKSPATKAKIAAAKQARSALNWELVRAIRASDMSNKAIADDLGVHPDTISNVRNHTSWREMCTPFSGLGARA